MKRGYPSSQRKLARPLADQTSKGPKSSAPSACAIFIVMTLGLIAVFGFISLYFLDDSDNDDGWHERLDQ